MNNPTQINTVMFVSAFKQLAEEIHQTAREKGWWNNKDADFLDVVAAESKNIGTATQLNEIAAKLRNRNEGEMLALIHSEVSEALEGLRHGNPADDKVPEFLATEAELADVVIRIMDMAHSRGWRVAEAIVAKAEMNKGRAPMHGGKKF